MKTGGSTNSSSSVLTGHHPVVQFKGAFAMLGWFDPGLEQEDYIGMHTTSADYARNRLKPTGASLDAYLSPRVITSPSYRVE